MSTGHNDPRLLYSIANINAYHIQDGEEAPLTPSGPQTLSLLMVPTSSPFVDSFTADPPAAPEEDFYLHLHLPPELDLSLPATTQIYHQPPRSYLIPRWDLGPDSGAFTRIEFPKIGTTPDRVLQEDVDTFETILAQCTAFLERAQPPSKKGYGDYNPAEYAPGEGYLDSDSKQPHRGHIVLIDEEDGSVVGELGEGYDLMEGPGVMAGSKSRLHLFKTLRSDANMLSRPCGDPFARTRPGKSNQRQQRVGGLFENGKAPGLQRFTYRPERGDGIAPHRDRFWIPFQRHQFWCGVVHTEDEGQSQTTDLHTHHSSENKKAE